MADRPRSKAEIALGITPQVIRTEMVLDPSKEPNRPMGDLTKEAKERQIDTGDFASTLSERGLDLGLFDPSKGPGNPDVNPISKLEEAVKSLAQQVSWVTQRMPSIEQGLAQSLSELEQLKAQGIITEDQFSQVQGQIDGMRQQMYPPILQPQGQEMPQQPPPMPQPQPPPAQPTPQPTPQPQQQPETAQAPRLQGAPPPGPGEPAMSPEGPSILPPSESPIKVPPGMEFQAPQPNALSREDTKPQKQGGPLSLQSPAQVVNPQHTKVVTSIKTSALSEDSDKLLSPHQILEVLLDLYDMDWEDWEEETLLAELSKDLELEDGIDEKTKNVLAGTRTVLSNPEGFWGQTNIFEDTVLQLNGMTPNYDGPDDMTPGQLLYGVRAAQELIDLPPDAEVQAYVAAKLLEKGITYAIPPLSWAQDEIDEQCRTQGLVCPDRTKIQVLLHQYATTSLEDAGLTESDPVEAEVERILAARDYVMGLEA